MPIRYITRRLLHMILVMWLVATAVFFIFRILPGDPAQMMLGLEPTRAALDSLRQQMGLDRPLHVQYFTWLFKAARGDLGESIFHSGKRIGDLVFPALWRTLELVILAMVVALAIAIPLGVISAVRAGSWVDQGARLFALTGFSLPSYWLGILLIIAFSFKIKLFPAGGYTPPGEDLVKHLKQLVLPIVTVGFIIAASLARFMRAGMLEVLKLDYVRTARAKGLPERTVIYKHALKNATLSLVTVLGINFGALVSGMVVTEQVFAWPGLGWLMVSSIFVRAYDVVQGAVLITAVAFVTINFLVDISYVLLDPRIAYD